MFVYPKKLLFILKSPPLDRCLIMTLAFNFKHRLANTVLFYASLGEESRSRKTGKAQRTEAA